MTSSRWILQNLLVAVALTAAACGGSSTTPSTTRPSTVPETVTTLAVGGVVFGEGVLPDSVPSGFPVPIGAVVGSTMVDPGSGTTEFVLTLPADVPGAADYFEQNLPIGGFQVTETGGTAAEWKVAFGNDAVEGTIVLRAAANGLSSAAVRIIETP